jgi:hypothetical protein
MTKNIQEMEQIKGSNLLSRKSGRRLTHKMVLDTDDIQDSLNDTQVDQLKVISENMEDSIEDSIEYSKADLEKIRRNLQKVGKSEPYQGSDLQEMDEHVLEPVTRYNVEEDHKYNVEKEKF